MPSFPETGLFARNNLLAYIVSRHADGPRNVKISGENGKQTLLNFVSKHAIEANKPWIFGNTNTFKRPEKNNDALL